MRNVPYQSAVGAIMYAMLATRPDVAYAITRLSQFSTSYGQKHWVALKRLLRYLHGTANYGITYGRVNDPQKQGLIGCCDSDWGFNEDRRSISGYSFIIAGGALVSKDSTSCRSLFCRGGIYVLHSRHKGSSLVAKSVH
jgi:hypothetical protein